MRHQTPGTAACPPGGSTHRGAVGYVLACLLLLQFAFVCARLWVPSLGNEASRWPEHVFFILAAAVPVAGLNRLIPLQNVVLVSTVIFLLTGIGYLLAATLGQPSRPMTFTQRFGPSLLGPLPWAAPFLWLVVILNSRGVARLILGPWRNNLNYGFLMLALTILLVVLFNLAFDPFATRVKAYWTWDASGTGPRWHDMPWTWVLWTALVTLLVLVLITPSLIPKRPGPTVTDYSPLISWLCINGWVLAGTVLHHLWTVVVLILHQTVIVLAILSFARHRSTPEPAVTG